MTNIDFHKEQFLNYGNLFLKENETVNNNNSTKTRSLSCESLASIENTMSGENSSKCLQLKISHTFNVLKNTETILKSLKNLSEHEKHIARLIALYHDIGRFEQFTEYGTFSDAKSINHATLGVKVLRRNHFIEQEDKETQSQVFCAILLHNLRDLPKKLNKNYLLQCQIIRDADKLDILRIFGEHLGNNLPEKESLLLNIQDEPTKWTDSVIETIENHQTVKYTDLRYANDFKLLLGAWVYNLNFPISKLIVKEKKLLDPILSSLPKNEAIQKITKKMYTYLDTLQI